MAVLLIARICAAQTAIPGVVDPGRIKQRLDVPETERQSQPRTPRISTRDLVAPEEADDIRFELKSMAIEGVTVYSDAELKPYYEQYLNETVTLKTVYEVLDAIIKRYRRDDYALISALIPSQDFTSGHIQVRFVEGYVSQLRLAQGEGLSTDDSLLESGQLGHYADAITSEQPLTKTTLQRNLLLANDIPGITLDGGFRRSRSTPGAVDVAVKLKQEQFETYGSIDNHGPEELGPTQLQVGASYHSLFRTGDSTSLTLGGTPDIDTLKYAFFKHSQIVGNGLRLGTDLGYVETRPDIDGLEGLEGEAKVASFSARYPVFRTLVHNLFIYGSFDLLDSDNAFLDRTISSDSLRSLRAGVFYNNRDDWQGNNSFNFSVSQGLDAFGAEGGSRPSGRVDYTKLNIFLERQQKLDDHFRLDFSVSGQYSFSSLLSPEEYGYGGREFGRAFRPSEITGDHGVAAGMELSYRKRRTGILRSYQPYAFIDAGKVWRRDDRFLLRQLAAASTGGGLRLELGEYFTIEMEAAQAIYRSVDAIGDNDWQFFIRLTGES